MKAIIYPRVTSLKVPDIDPDDLTYGEVPSIMEYTVKDFKPITQEFEHFPRVNEIIIAHGKEFYVDKIKHKCPDNTTSSIEIHCKFFINRNDNKTIKKYLKKEKNINGNLQ